MPQDWETWSEGHIEAVCTKLGFAREESMLNGVGRALAMLRKELGEERQAGDEAVRKEIGADMRARNDTVLELVMERLEQIEGRLEALEATAEDKSRAGPDGIMCGAAVVS